MAKLLFSLLLLFNVSSLQAQIDTEFWFAAPEVTSVHADRPILLNISTMELSASVTISQPANPAFTPITLSIPANNTESIDLTYQIDSLENKPADVVLNKGLLIQSSEKITAYYEVLGSRNGKPDYGVINTDIFALKGRNALGTKFYTPFQNYWDNITNVSGYAHIDAWSSFDIVATEDGTVVTITPTNDIVGHTAGVAFSINLNKGQTYSARAVYADAAHHLSGSLVTSNKPIAITTKDDSLYDAPNWDLAGDQLIPVDLTGMEYVVMKGSVENLDTSKIADRVFICATENSTDIFIDGSSIPVATIQAGETFMYHLNQLKSNNSYFIKTSQPVYVLHITSFGKQGDSGHELAGALLPPIGCTGSRQIGFTKPVSSASGYSFALNIVVKTGGENYFKLNGSSSLVPPSSFDTVPGTNGLWKAAQISFNDSQLPAEEPDLIKNDSADFHLGILNGDNQSGFMYGYFSDYGVLLLGNDKSACKGDSVTFDAGAGLSSYLWNTGAQTQKITVKDSGTYSVKITKGICVLKRTADTVKFSINPDPRKVLGKDTAYCSDKSFKITMDTLYTSYVWQNGSKDSTFKPTVSGTYWVEVKNQFGCKTRDSIDIIIYNTPKAKINFDQDLEKICGQATVTLDAGPGYATYKWNDGSTLQTLTTTHLPEYYVTVTDLNGCVDSTNLYIDCSPYVKVYNMFTPNGDGHNDVFYVEGLKPDKWILEIVNRWGDRVYYNRSYNNDFDGKNLDSGIYFYNLRHVEGKKTFKGWVHIIKD